MATYFTSDTHFGHINIIGYSDRPVARDSAHPESGLVRPSEVDTGFTTDVHAMDEEMILRWNEVVAPGDTVYHLGDFIMGKNPVARARAIRDRLNGKITLIRGNHDKIATVMSAGFDVALEYVDSLDGLPIALRHQPFEYGEFGLGPFPFYGKAKILLCGHVHERWKVKRFSERVGVMINAGVDQWDFRPVSLSALLAAAGETLSL